MDSLFIQNLMGGPEERFYYFSVVFTLIVSIVLHELAHGWMAIRLGDDTPIRLGHMTGNPLIHMGPISLALVIFMGMGWGMMPIDPTRLRGRRSESLVAVAGPAMNILLALIGLTIYQAVFHSSLGAGTPFRFNALHFLWIFGYFNIGLAIFNLAPVPPLDGSRILGDFSHGFRRMLIDTEPYHIMAFGGYIVVLNGLDQTGRGLGQLSAHMADHYLNLLGRLF